MQEEQIIIIADDHPLFRDALRQAIESEMSRASTIMVGDFGEVESAITEYPQADLLLLDLYMPGANGFSGLVQLRKDYPALPIVMVSASEDHATIQSALKLGASGFITKSTTTQNIRKAIQNVLAGELSVPENFDPHAEDDDEISDIVSRIDKLTPQQNRVLGMLGDGLLNKQIAYALDVSEATVKAHVSAVLLKLGVDSRTQAVIMFSKLNASNQTVEPII